jgi:CRP-like cAMP-binding protein
MENSEKEKNVERFIRENNLSAAVGLLFELILSYADKKDFGRAEVLREKLISVDPMALPEIIKSGEIIEQLQADSIDRKHLEIWSVLYGLLTMDEKNKLFFATQEVLVRAGEIFLEQGKANPFLYLIGQGHVQMSFRLKNKEIMVKRLGPGDFAGDDTFLSIQAFSSVTLVAESEVKVRKLPKENFSQWNKSLPGLYSKLSDYLYKAGTTQDHINAMKIKRRTQNRSPLSGNGWFQFLDNKDAETGNPVKGSLLDISMGGMSFAIRISKKETARLILGRRLNAQFEALKGKEPVTIDRTGIIVSVGEYNLDDYALHMKFDLLLDETLIKAIEEENNKILQGREK